MTLGVINSGDDAVGHVLDAVGEIKDAVVVGHDNHGALVVERDVAQEFHDRATRGCVE